MDDQQIKQLAASAALRRYPGPVKIFSTHISWVLAGPVYAYKIKKPLKLSFLDFSSPSLRRYYCQRELELNARLTSAVYLDVLPIVEQDGEIILGGTATKLIDYAVQMKRLDNHRLMSAMLGRGAVSSDQCRRLAEIVGRFHVRTDRIRSAYSADSVRRIVNNILNVRDRIVMELGGAYAAMLDRAIAAGDRYLQQHGSYVEERMERGFVRDCHGDLHSGNIFLYANPVIFDCIEFSDRYRQIDVLSELAFLCMDLESWGREDLSRTLRDHYLQIVGMEFDRPARRLFTFFQCYRANVRAKVNAIKAGRTTNAAAKLQTVEEVRKYLHLMDSYTDRLVKHV